MLDRVEAICDLSRSATLGNLIKNYYNFWLCTKKNSDQREELNGGKELVCLTESKRSATWGDRQILAIVDLWQSVLNFDQREEFRR